MPRTFTTRLWTCCGLLLGLLVTSAQAQSPNDPRFNEQYYLQTINIQNIWGATTGSTADKIAIIGGGNVFPTHEDLGAKTTIRTRGVHGSTNIPFDQQPGVGTAAAGVAAAITNNSKGIAGVNWNASILSYDPATLGEGPDGTPLVHMPLLTKIDDDVNSAVADGADVLITPFIISKEPNDVTFAYDSGVESVTIPDDVPEIGGVTIPAFFVNFGMNIMPYLWDYVSGRELPWNDAMYALRDAYTAGRVIVAPSGDFEGTTKGIPAGLSADRIVITTGSISPDTDEAYQFSGSGGSSSPMHANIDVVAPGVNVLTTVVESGMFSTYEYATSTAISAGLVGGIASLLISIDSNLTPEDIRQVLRRTAHDIGTPGFDAESGAGLVDAQAALGYVQSNYFTHGTATNGTITDVFTIPSSKLAIESGAWGGPSPGVYLLATDDDIAGDRQEVRFEVDLPDPSRASEYDVWYRPAGTQGWLPNNPNPARPWARAEIDEQAGKAVFTTYVYNEIVPLGGPGGWEWLPASPQDARVAYTIAGPPGPPAVTINGSSCVDHGYTGTFYANVDGGVPPYSYDWERHYCSGGTVPLSATGDVSTQDLPPGGCQWTGLIGGSGSSVDIPNMTEDHDLRVTVTDAIGQTAQSSTFHVDVEAMCVSGSEGQTTEAVEAANLRAASQKVDVVEQPETYALEAAYPNPFNPRTTIRFALPEATDVELVVYDALGREVERLVEGPVQAGRHEAVFEAKRLPSGVYLYELRAGRFTETGRMVLAK